jgi:hypothetical protein
MKNFLKKVLAGNKISPTEECLQSFNLNFTEAINVEWFKHAAHYEAIFYNNKIECIALFQANGTLLEYRQNIPQEYLPEIIKNQAQTKGEIMNTVLSNKGNMLAYEIIIRDTHLNRYCLNISESGEIVSDKKL